MYDSCHTRGLRNINGESWLMNAQVSVRLPEDLRRELDAVARARGVRRSRVLREALRLYLRGAPGQASPYQRVRELAGVAYGGPDDLGAAHRDYLREILGGG